MWQKNLETWAPPRSCYLPFPAYAFHPGRNPHPRTSPDGHSFGESHPTEGNFNLDKWQEEERWLFAADLYNRGFFWESHEYWEALWHAEGRSGIAATLLQALIQTAAAHIKCIDGNLVGVEILASKSDAMFSDLHAMGVSSLFGLDLGDFRVRRNNWFALVLQGVIPATGLFPFLHLQGARS